MNASTVFPEGYVDNERMHQSSARKQDKNSNEQERLQRKWYFPDIFLDIFPAQSSFYSAFLNT